MMAGRTSVFGIGPDLKGAGACKAKDLSGILPDHLWLIRGGCYIFPFVTYFVTIKS
jgi:hypothetical protein